MALACSAPSSGGADAGDGNPPGTAAQQLVGLEVSAGTLAPAFDPDVMDYAVELPLGIQSISVTPTVADPQAGTITVNGALVASETPSSPIVLDVGANTIDVVSSAGDSSLTYSITVNRATSLLQEAYAKASNTGAGDEFGYRIALSGDTLVVGARSEDSAARSSAGSQEDDSARNSGAAYVFVRSGDTWRQQAYLKASNSEDRAYFGSSLAVDGDTLAVGAPGERNAGPGAGEEETKADSGAVYVFERADEAWSEQAYLKASTPDIADEFGRSVALDGDTLAVGATGEDSAATGIDGDEADNSDTQTGAVYVFVRTGNSWTQEAYVKASNTGSFDHFGHRVALDNETLAVSAVNERSAATGIDGDQSNDDADRSGAVYVFVRTGDTWSQQAYVKASNSGAHDLFGWSMALDGNTLAVGAVGEDSDETGVAGNEANDDASSSGAVYVFVRDGDSWSQDAYVKASNSDAEDEFGSAVALDGNTLAVGAVGEDSAAMGVNGDQSDNDLSRSGAVYVLVRSRTGWSHQVYIKASTHTYLYDEFGGSLTLDRGTLAVGAVGQDSGATGIDGNPIDSSADESGAVYLFR